MLKMCLGLVSSERPVDIKYYYIKKQGDGEFVRCVILSLREPGLRALLVTCLVFLWGVVVHL